MIERAIGGIAHLIAVSSERKPESSSSDAALLAARDDCLEPVRELEREASREAALRETVLPLSKIWRRRSGMMKRCVVFELRKYWDRVGAEVVKWDEKGHPIGTELW
jgi:hypothetical protein